MRLEHTRRLLAWAGVLVATQACRGADQSGTRSSDPERGGAEPPGAPATVTEQKERAMRRADEKPREAEADFVAQKPIELGGKVELEEVDNGVRLKVKVDDAPPGKKGIHVHEKGDCSDIPALSMREHLHGDGHEHGLPGSPKKHVGDLGNIQIAPDGNGSLEITAPGANLKPNDPKSFLGRAIVIHAGEDTGKDPGGAPIACGVIKPT